MTAPFFKMPVITSYSATCQVAVNGIIIPPRESYYIPPDCVLTFGGSLVERTLHSGLSVRVLWLPPPQVHRLLPTGFLYTPLPLHLGGDALLHRLLLPAREDSMGPIFRTIDEVQAVDPDPRMVRALRYTREEIVDVVRHLLPVGLEDEDQSSSSPEQEQDHAQRCEHDHGRTHENMRGEASDESGGSRMDQWLDSLLTQATGLTDDDDAETIPEICEWVNCCEHDPSGRRNRW